MSGSQPTGPPGEERKPSFLSVGWLLILGFIVVSAIVGWRMIEIVRERTVKAIGDGEHVETYGFDLSTLLIPRETLVSSGMPKDGLRSIDHPSMISPSDVDTYNRDHRGKYVVSSDRVVGVFFDGEARAYPLRVLNWHEIVNDTVGGRPVCVTYNPLCDSVVVFDPTLDGKTVSFGFSGLLYNSNLLMYDRQPEATGESLWSQLQFRAVAGPAATEKKTLTVLPCEVVQWREWVRMHPDTGILSPDSMYMERYGRNPYANYYGTPNMLQFPVKPLPPKNFEGMKWKTPVVVVGAGTGRRVVPLPVIAAKANDSGEWTTALDHTTYRFTYRDNPPTAAVTLADGKEPGAVAYAFWFAWYSTHPDAEKEIVQAPGSNE